MKTLRLAILTLGCSLGILVSLSARGPITFEERVKAQEAIERVYYNHRIWPKENPQPKPPFEQMVPRAVIEAKVTDYLKKCTALDKYWQRPITPEQLQAEMDRMAKGTKDPATLKELFTALGNNPYMVAECLARPVLADRLIHNWYAYDSRFHSRVKGKAQEARIRTKANPQAFSNCDDGQTYRLTYKLKETDDLRDTGKPRRTGIGGLKIPLSQEEFAKKQRLSPKVGEIELKETRDSFGLIPIPFT